MLQALCIPAECAGVDRFAAAVNQVGVSAIAETAGWWVAFNQGHSAPDQALERLLAAPQHLAVERIDAAQWARSRQAKP